MDEIFTVTMPEVGPLEVTTAAGDQIDTVHIPDSEEWEPDVYRSALANDGWVLTDDWVQDGPDRVAHVTVSPWSMVQEQRESAARWLADAVKAAEERIDGLRSARDLVITAALDGGASVYRMAAITGLSQTMIAKIRKHA